MATLSPEMRSLSSMVTWTRYSCKKLCSNQARSVVSDVQWNVIVSDSVLSAHKKSISTGQSIVAANAHFLAVSGTPVAL